MPDDQRLSSERRVIEDLHRSKERVHVGMDEDESGIAVELVQPADPSIPALLRWSSIHASGQDPVLNRVGLMANRRTDG